jgi:TatD DNase family protein
VVALGECGLDYFRNYSPHADQQRAFAEQLKLAVDARKPVFLHQRDAHAAFLPMLREHRPQLVDAVVHCFTDTAAALEDYLSLDCHIGITGWICDERRGQGVRDAARLIPDDKLLVETDAPYLLPRTAPKAAHRRNEPACLPYVVRALAEARGQPEQHVARITTENAARFFRLA